VAQAPWGTGTPGAQTPLGHRHPCGTSTPVAQTPLGHSWHTKYPTLEQHLDHWYHSTPTLYFYESNQVSRFRELPPHPPPISRPNQAFHTEKRNAIYQFSRESLTDILLKARPHIVISTMPNIYIVIFGIKDYSQL
jgi:hypothetical protein